MLLVGLGQEPPEIATGEPPNPLCGAWDGTLKPGWLKLG